MNDWSEFPDPVYAETVLTPLFDGARLNFVEGFARIDRAHLVMLAETGILPAGTARDIARALTAIGTEVDPAALRYTGEVEDYFFLVEGELKRRLGPDAGGRLHTARSRNDIDHTLFKMALTERLDRFIAEARALLEALVAKARAEAATIIVAYTHGQPAQPTTFGHYLSAAIEVLARDIERAEAALADCELCSMGAAAITTTGFPIDRMRVAALLGFTGPQRNSYGCIARVDYTTGAYSALELAMLHLGRVVQDLQVWSSFEVSQIHVPDAFVQTSSIMPQKRNPVPIEHMRHLASQAMGRARLMRDVMHNTPFTDMNDSEGESQEAGWQAFDAASRVVRLLAAFVPAIRVDADRVDANIRRSCITITELADTLVRDEGLSFRQAHEIAAATARAVVAAGGDLPGGWTPFSDAFEAETGRAPALSPEAFARAVSPEHFVAVRDRFGGPAPGAMAEALAHYEETASALRIRAEARDARRRRAAEDLSRASAAIEGNG